MNPAPRGRCFRALRYTDFSMQRRAVLFFLLFAMFWQSLALARTGSIGLAMADPAHAALHWQGTSHHHHDDGTYAQDVSQESMQHLHCDHVNASAALLGAAAPGLPVLASTAPQGLPQACVPNPLLDGLLRPPQPVA